MSAAAPVRPMNNPVLDEINAAHAALSPQAQQAVAMARDMGGAAPSPEPAQAGPVSPITPPSSTPVAGIPVSRGATPATPGIAAPGAAPNPVAMAHKTELARLTGGGPDPNQGKSGIDQIHSPWARIPLQIASAVGSGLFPGIAMGIPGTQLHHNLLVRGAENAVKSDEDQANNATKRNLEEAQTEKALHPESKVATNEMERFFQQNPQATVGDWRQFQLDHPEKDGKAESGTVHEDDQGNFWVFHPDGSATAVAPKGGGAQIKGKTASEEKGTVHETADGKMWVVKSDGTAVPVRPKDAASEGQDTQLTGKVPAKTVPPEQQYIDEYRTKNPQASIADALKAYKKDTAAPEHAPQALMIGADGKAMVVRPGSTVPQGAMTPGGVNSMNVPTSSSRTMTEAAPKVLELATRVGQLVDAQEKSLGPAGSRWSEFMAGKVGAPNPDFTKLRTDVALLQTALMRMHVGARGGPEMMEHFRNLIDTSKQSPENLRAALEEIRSYAEMVQKHGGGQGSEQEQSGGGDAAVKAYADKYFGGDLKKAQDAIAAQKKK